MEAIELQSLVDAQEHPFLVIDQNFEIVAVNAAFEEAYKTNSEQVIGRPCYRVSHRNSRPCWELGEDCPLKRMNQSAAPKPYSCLHVHHDDDGRIHHVRLTAYPLKGADGNFYMGEAMHELSVQDPHGDGTARMVGRAPAFLEAIERLHVAAESDVPVLLTGETGTGKELAASFIHRRSARCDGSFVTLDCTVLNEGLFESEVFGHERGAFTGSIERRKGLFEIADGGTLFLDEIGELSPVMQSKLLRVLESGAFRRVGGRQMLHADVRTVCATNRDVVQDIKAGKFRADLYYRIACLSVHLPSLRERPEDIPELASTILQDINRNSRRRYDLGDEALALLQERDFPGNIRELRNILFAAAAQSARGSIEAPQIAAALNAGRSVPVYAGQVSDAAPVCAAQSCATLHDLEAQHVARLLRKNDGNRRKAAAALGVSERTLYRKLNRYGLG